MEEEKIAPEAGANNAPEQDNSTATPAIKEEIDPRIVEIVGEEKIQEAYGDKPQEDGKPADDVKVEDAPPADGEDPQKKEVENNEAESHEVTAPEYKPGRLDKKIAKSYIQNLIMLGEENIPTEEQVFADLRKHPMDAKIAALHFHRLKGKELRGENTDDGDELDEEDHEAIKDEERETIRQEIISEENEKQYKRNFVSFVAEHTELVPDDAESKKNYPNKKPFDPVMAKAVAKLTFPYGTDGPAGMDIKEAYETVTSQIQAVKEAQVLEEKKVKSAALSGVLSGAGQVPQNGKELDWDDVARIQSEDPALYRRMVAEGKFKHLN